MFYLAQFTNLISGIANAGFAAATVFANNYHLDRHFEVAKEERTEQVNGIVGSMNKGFGMIEDNMKLRRKDIQTLRPVEIP